MNLIIKNRLMLLMLALGGVGCIEATALKGLETTPFLKAEHRLFPTGKTKTLQCTYTVENERVSQGSTPNYCGSMSPSVDVFYTGAYYLNGPLLHRFHGSIGYPVNSIPPPSAAFDNIFGVTPIYGEPDYCHRIANLDNERWGPGGSHSTVIKGTFLSTKQDQDQRGENEGQRLSISDDYKSFLPSPIYRDGPTEEDTSQDHIVRAHWESSPQFYKTGNLQKQSCTQNVSSVDETTSPETEYVRISAQYSITYQLDEYAFDQTVEFPELCKELNSEGTQCAKCPAPPVENGFNLQKNSVEPELSLDTAGQVSYQSNLGYISSLGGNFPDQMIPRLIRSRREKMEDGQNFFLDVIQVVIGKNRFAYGRVNGEWLSAVGDDKMLLRGGEAGDPNETEFVLHTKDNSVAYFFGERVWPAPANALHLPFLMKSHSDSTRYERLGSEISAIINESTNQRLDLEYHDGLLVRIMESNGNVWTFGRDENNQLSVIIDPNENFYQFGFSSTSSPSPSPRIRASVGSIAPVVEVPPMLTSITDRSGRTSFLVEYDINQKPVMVKNPGVQIITSTRTETVSPDPLPDKDDARHGPYTVRTAQTQEYDRTVAVWLDKNGNAVGQTINNNVTWWIRFFKPGLPELVYHQNGTVTAFAYDEKNREIASKTISLLDVAYEVPSSNSIDNALSVPVDFEPEPEVCALPASFSLNGEQLSHLQRSDETIKGYWTILTGASAGCLSTSIVWLPIKGSGNNTQYNQEGQVASITDSLGQLFTFQRDSFGRILAENQPRGGSLRIERDSTGKIVRSIGVTDIHYSYYPAGHPMAGQLEEKCQLTGSHTSPALACFKYTWDKNSNVTSITDPLGFVTSFDLDLMGRVIAIHEPSQIPGQPAASTYLTLDGEGRVLSSKDAIGRETRYTYNSDGFLVEVIAPDASRTFYEYQGDRLHQITDQRGGIWLIEYNGENQITKITDPEGNQSSTTYNQYGQKVSESDFLGRIVSYTYDRLGNLFSITDPSGAQTELLYDPNGRLIKKILPDGETEELSWEQGDFLAQKKRIAAMGSGTTPSERIQSFLGDEYGRITQSVTSQNETWPQTYDAASLLEKTNFPEGGFLLSRYDSLNRPEKLIDRGGAERVFTYTPQGQEKSLKMPPTAQNPQGRETIREYNLAGELVRIIYPDLSTEEIERDLMGRPIRIIYTPSASGSGSSPPIPNSAPAHSEELILTYNQAGDLVEMRSQLPGGQNPKTITHTFDILGRLISKELPFLSRRIELEYNAASELVTKREINTQTQAIRTSLYAYTNRGELASLTENGSTTLFEYSPGGKITKITYPEGISLTQSYNGFGELESQIWKNSSDETLHEIFYEYNLNGKVTRITTPEGQTQNNYDSESRLIQTIHPDGNTETFIFNSAGYLSEKKDNSHRLVMSYNESGQVIEVLEYIPPTAPAHTSRLVWNWYADGLLRSIQNTTTNTATYYLWNAQKKLEGVAFTDGTSTAYAYLPGSDLRLSSVNRSGTATLFHWDGVQLREVLNPSEGSPNSPPVAIGGRATNLPNDSNPAQTITSAYLTGLPGTWDEVLTVSIPDGENPENLLLFLQNHQSSVVGTLETSNPLVSRKLFGYLAYGEPEGTSPENLPLSGIGYTGRQHDDTGLMYYRGRYRDSCTGTFIQEDKMRDGWNWYGYTSDPVNMVDPSGYFNFDTLNISDLVTGTKRFGPCLVIFNSLAYPGAGFWFVCGFG